MMNERENVIVRGIHAKWMRDITILCDGPLQQWSLFMRLQFHEILLAFYDDIHFKLTNASSKRLESQLSTWSLINASQH